MWMRKSISNAFWVTKQNEHSAPTLYRFNSIEIFGLARERALSCSPIFGKTWSSVICCFDAHPSTMRYFQKKPDSTNFLSTLNLCPKSILLNILTFVWWHLQTIPKHYFVASAWFKYVQTIFSLHIFCIISFDGALWKKKMHNIFTFWLF